MPRIEDVADTPAKPPLEVVAPVLAVDSHAPCLDDGLRRIMRESV